MQQRCASRTAKKQFDYMRIATLILILLMCSVPVLVLAQETPTEQSGEAAVEETPADAEEATLNSGDTAWMLTATALVLFMTIPGLALFYGGLVRVQNVLSVLMQCFALTGLISILWIVIGYSLAFNTAGMEAGKITFNSFVGVLVHFSLLVLV